jgi:hypothetical protein
VLLFGLVIGWPALSTALALLREFRVLPRMYSQFACGARSDVAAVSEATFFEDATGLLPAHLADAQRAVRDQDIRRRYPVPG